MNRPLASFALSPLLICASFAFAQEREGSARVLESLEDQVAEYIRRFPYQTTYDFTQRFTGGNPSNFNRWLGQAALVRAGDDILPRTNNDTFYRAAALILTDGPVVLESSTATDDRFNSFQLIDERNANYRNIVFPAGKYTVFFGARPAAIEGEAIEAPSAFGVVIARVEVRDKNDAADVAAAKAVYDGMKMDGAPPVEIPRVDLLSSYPAAVVAEANRRMDETFLAVPFGATVVGPGMEPGHDVPYLYHSAGTKGGWGGPDPKHSAFENLFVDAGGNETTGDLGPYRVTTTPPPVDAFWSVTVYDTGRGGYLHPNDRNIYHINDTTAVRNVDGSVTFMFTRDCESADVNCLDVPAGRFDVTVRYYLPRAEILSGQWRFPRLEPALENPVASPR
jgi:hypothetical protein